MACHRIRVLHVLHTLNRGGIETWLVHVLRHVDPARVRMDFVTDRAISCDYDDDIRKLGGAIYPCLSRESPRALRGVPLGRLAWTWHAYAQGFKQILKEHGPYEIVHSHYDPCGFPLQLAQRAGVSVRIAHSHSTFPAFARHGPLVRAVLQPLARRMVRSSATLGFAASREAAAAMFGRHWQEERRWKILYCGIDLKPFTTAVDPASLRAELGIASGKLVLGHVGRFTAEKNHSFLIDILAEVIKREPSAHLLLVGDGPLRTDVAAKISRLDLDGHVSLLGMRSDVPHILLGAVDVFLFPSSHEGLGLAMVEAQAAGLPCVVSAAVPAEADVVPGLIQRLSLSQPAARWAEAILKVRSQAVPLSRAESLSAVRQSPFNIERSVETLRLHYLEALEKIVNERP